MWKSLCLLVCVACSLAASDLATYRLLEPSTHSFELAYDVTIAREGAAYFYNPLRPGSTVAKESAVDLASGKPLEMKIATGREVKAAGGAPASTPDSAQFLWVKLLRPVPKGAETRIRILRTYTDAASYHATANGFVFERPLEPTRDIVLLPAGYELIGSRAPGIVTLDAEQRIHISFFNDRDDQLPVHIEGRKRP